MADKLKPGGLGDVDESGTPLAFADSMAQAMEVALNNLLSDEGKPRVPTDNSAATRDRRIMFLAIAQGIVDHLVQNQDAFVITHVPGPPLGDHRIVIEQE